MPLKDVLPQFRFGQASGLHASTIARAWLSLCSFDVALGSQWAPHRLNPVGVDPIQSRSETEGLKAKISEDQRPPPMLK